MFVNASRNQITARNRRQASLTLQVLEDRTMPAVTTAFIGGVLTIRGDADDNHIVVRRDANNAILLNGQPIAGNPNTDNTQKIRIFAGDGHDNIELNQEENGPHLTDGGGFEPRGKREIEIHIHGGKGYDDLEMHGIRGHVPNHIDLGTRGININHDNDVDISLHDIESTLTVHGGVADDVINAGGSRVVGKPFPKSLLLGGAEGNDVLIGGRGGDFLVGAKGDDRLVGKHGEDTLIGGDGDDSLFGGPGHDWLLGDNAYGEYGVDGNDRLFGGRGHDSLEAGGGDDLLFGQWGDDELYGEKGYDRLFGGRGHDWLLGGDGNDQIFGQAGNDRLGGDAGNDALFGGRGRDGWNQWTEETGDMDLLNSLERIEEPPDFDIPGWVF